MSQNRVLTAVLRLRDMNFGAGMGRASQGMDRLRRQTQHTRNQISRFANDSGAQFKKMALGVGGLVTAYAGFNKIGEFISSGVDEAKAMIEQETKLQTIMKNTKGVTDAQIKSVMDYANAQEELGVVGADVQIAGAQQMATFQLQASTIKTLMPAMNDLVAQTKGVNATTQDGVGVGNLMGKVMNGQVGALSKLGINFTKAQEKVLKYGTESQKAATLAEVLKMNVGGVNKALAETDEGKIKQADDQFGALREQVGGVVLMLKTQFARWFVQYIPVIKKNLTFLLDGLVNGLDAAKPHIDRMGANLKQGFEKAKPTLIWLKDKGLPKIKQILGGVVTVAKDVIDFFTTHWTTLKPIVLGVAAALGIWKIAQIGVNLAMNANPVGLVITAIGLLVVGVIELVKHWDAVKRKAIEIWDRMGKLKLIIAAIGGPITAVVIAGLTLIRHWDEVKAKAVSLWEGIKTTFSGVGEFFTNTFQGAVEGIKGFFRPVVDMINMLIDGINNIQVDPPGWVKDLTGMGSFGFDIPRIPEFAMGTAYAKDGLALMHERGGEIRRTSSGEAIIPADKSERLLDKAGGGNVINVNINGSGLTPMQVVNELVPMLKTALANL
ncbi:phage tail tape measure protein [Cohnella cholangitidis]|uniref:Phage tail tape measure protein n=1 Tax=Cohnella cholangitidis TaxID=2598458 RepID=A0A7G5C3G0_9BACL|nr:hypothetical protein [Cohnella cholangitidis]QMV43744.1 hypothetical protein FPL14_23150 [Cohnella cholangitidis]